MLEVRRLVQAILFLAAAGCSLVPVGCRAEVNRVCDTLCDCTGCSEARFLECIETTEAVEAQAIELGCGSAFTTYILCIEDEVECRNDKSSFDGCEEDEEALQECGVSVFRNYCELANAHQANECMLGQFTPDPSQCEGTIECQAKCNIETSCQGLNGIDPVEFERLNECVSRCASPR